MTPSAETYTAVAVGVLLGITGLCIAGAPWSVLAIAVAVAAPAYALVRHLDTGGSMFSRLFLLDAAERALKSFAQGALLALGQDALGVDLFSVDFANVIGTGGGMALISVLTSIVSAGRDGLSPASLVAER